MKDWLFTGENYICDLRSVGVLVRDGKILVQRERNGSEYALPGGHVMIGETTEETLVREYREETGAAIRLKRLLWTEECFWQWNERQVHNIAFYYLIELMNEYDLTDSGEIFSQKDNDDVLFEWMSIERLSQITIYPSFIQREINCLDGEIKHFISCV